MKIPFLSAWKQRKKQEAARTEELERRREEMISLRKSHAGLVALVRHLVHHATEDTRRDLTSNKPVERIVPPGCVKITMDPFLEITQDRIYIRGYYTNTVCEFVRAADGTIRDLHVIS